jgi:hypothetical protein
MMQDHRLHRHGFGLKYLVNEAMTLPIRDFVASYVNRTAAVQAVSPKRDFLTVQYQ